MTPEEYERRPEVKAALTFVRSRPELMRSVGWSSYANRLMDALGIAREERKYTGGWEIPVEFLYAAKRAVAGWSKKDAFRQVVMPAIKSGRIRLGSVKDWWPGPSWFEIISTTWVDSSGKKHPAIRLTWDTVEYVLGREHSGQDDDDNILIQNMLEHGAPHWIEEAEGGIDISGWYLYDPSRVIE